MEWNLKLSANSIIPRVSALWPLVLAVVYIATAIFALNDYIEFSSPNFIIGAAGLPVLMQQSKKQGKSARFGWVSLLVLAACYWLPVKTALYVGIYSALLYVWEQYQGRVTVLAFTVLLLMSPVAGYFAHVFSFPIRLWLTDIAAQILHHAGLEISVAGNMLLTKQGDFSVDPACMGLNMLITSILCGIIMLAIYLHKAGTTLRFYQVIMLVALLFGLNIVANLIRILLLVYFKWMPETLMHDAAGIGCLALYVLLPASFIAKKMATKYSRSVIEIQSKKHSKIGHKLHFILLPLMAVAVYGISEKTKPNHTVESLPIVPGYVASHYDNEVIKLQSPTALIYLKPLRNFIYTDHNPLICWTGSGYNFEQIEEAKWGSVQLFTGVLTRGNEKLYTAWWYDNGSTKTTSQLLWRWTMLRGGAPFSIINVTTQDRSLLKPTVLHIAAHPFAM